MSVDSQQKSDSLVGGSQHSPPPVSKASVVPVSSTPYTAADTGDRFETQPAPTSSHSHGRSPSLPTSTQGENLRIGNRFSASYQTDFETEDRESRKPTITFVTIESTLGLPPKDDPEEAERRSIAATKASEFIDHLKEFDLPPLSQGGEALLDAVKLHAQKNTDVTISSAVLCNPETGTRSLFMNVRGA